MSVASVNYDSISSGYSARRVPDPRIGASIDRALGSAKSIINIGAGTGSYEPKDRAVVAVDASFGMLAQRSGDVPAVQAVAEQLPFESGAFDSATAILTLHHWTDQCRGLREAVRVTKSKVVLLTWVGSLTDLPAINVTKVLKQFAKHLISVNCVGM
jgi:ubiquinone/menaquinone biosynthesis C-methylase UbiE